MFQPIMKRVMLRKAPKKSTSSLILIAGAEEPVGIVSAVGSEVTLVSVGDKVLFSGYPLGSFIEEGEEFAIFNEENILGRYIYELRTDSEPVPMVQEDSGVNDAACGTSGGNMDLVHPVHE